MSTEKLLMEALDNMRLNCHPSNAQQFADLERALDAYLQEANASMRVILAALEKKA